MRRVDDLDVVQSRRASAEVVVLEIDQHLNEFVTIRGGGLPLEFGERHMTVGPCHSLTILQFVQPRRRLIRWSLARTCDQSRC
jgi:hypothetical protein